MRRTRQQLTLLRFCRDRFVACRDDTRIFNHEYYCPLGSACSMYRGTVSDSKLNATESPKLFATEKKSRDIIVLLLE
jgi:hypothetical protein